MLNCVIGAEIVERAEASLQLEGMDPTGTPLYAGVSNVLLLGK